LKIFFHSASNDPADGAVTFDEIEKDRGKKKKVSYFLKTENETVIG